jgi:NAD(P)-dependent dehydrogenase (short-subunit alcohol dehydrogenase family)
MRLKGKVAVVTGGGTGLGRAIARRFGLEGAQVVVNGRRPEPIRSVAAEIAAAGGQALAIPADVTRPADIASLIHATLDAWGRLDVLVNNAGILVSRTTAAECSEQDWARTLEADLTAVFRCSQAALPELRKTRGNIVNVSSVAGLKGSPSVAAYAAAKAGVVNLSKTMALECARDGVRVNAVCPGFVETDLNRGYVAQLKATGGYDALVSRHPLGLGTPDDVAWAAVYLASDEARWVTGVALPVDGGFMAGL